MRYLWQCQFLNLNIQSLKYLLRHHILLIIKLLSTSFSTESFLLLLYSWCLFSAWASADEGARPCATSDARVHVPPEHLDAAQLRRVAAPVRRDHAHPHRTRAQPLLPARRMGTPAGWGGCWGGLCCVVLNFMKWCWIKSDKHNTSQTRLALHGLEGLEVTKNSTSSVRVLLLYKKMSE